ncbi:hypothetical protein HAX54_042569 [Datura stramonium]|uniref:Uncharacterized protein n=1 Tax=Datura stramonium TaxID=4076 RepID=A0ABS8W042_DATST|nr:hypothetical protein [Datura stramonium]
MYGATRTPPGWPEAEYPGKTSGTASRGTTPLPSNFESGHDRSHAGWMMALSFKIAGLQVDNGLLTEFSSLYVRVGKWGNSFLAQQLSEGFQRIWPPGDWRALKTGQFHCPEREPTVVTEA